MLGKIIYIYLFIYFEILSNVLSLGIILKGFLIIISEEIIFLRNILYSNFNGLMVGYSNIIFRFSMLIVKVFLCMFR